MRGPHLEAVQADGLTLRVGDAEFKANVRAPTIPRNSTAGRRHLDAEGH
jgi:hypothetical protein